LLIQFPDADAAQAWLQDPTTVTERAIATKQVEAMTVLLIRPGFGAGAASLPTPAQSPRQ
jgi:hypothetical protein